MRTSGEESRADSPWTAGDITAENYNHMLDPDCRNLSGERGDLEIAHMYSGQLFCVCK